VPSPDVVITYSLDKQLSVWRVTANECI